MFKYIQIEKLLLEGKSVSDIAEIVPSTIDYAIKIKSKLGIVNGTEQMVEHHTHYKEIHGYDKTVWMTRSDHSKLHQRLRKNGECNVPVDELKIIALAAHDRNDKSKKHKRKYEYDHKQKNKSKHDYIHRNMWQKQYWTHMMPNIFHVMTIQYNSSTNTVSVTGGFYGTHKKPLVIDII